MNKLNKILLLLVFLASCQSQKSCSYYSKNASIWSSEVSEIEGLINATKEDVNYVFMMYEVKIDNLDNPKSSNDISYVNERKKVP